MAIEREGKKLYIRGAITVNNAAEIARQGVALLDDDKLVIDLKEVTEVDSSAVSMLFEWLRLAQARNQRLKFVNIPENLSSLIQLYGVTDFIPSDIHLEK